MPVDCPAAPRVAPSRPTPPGRKRSKGNRALAGARGVLRRIRLVAYGARLESVLGESPRGFESPILRTRSEPPRSNSPHQLSTNNQSAGENAMTATVTTLRVRPRRSLLTTAFVPIVLAMVPV